MYAASRPGGLDSGATINPAALSSPDLWSRWERKRGVSLNSNPNCAIRSGDDGDSRRALKEAKPMKSQAPRTVSGETPVPPPTIPSMSHVVPPSQNAQTHDGTMQPQPSPAYSAAPAPAAAPPKTTPTKSTLKALPTVRDHTTDQLNEANDEYIPREIDEFGEKKVMANGTLLGNRQYRCRTFLVPNRGDKLFMLATECARVLGYRDSYLLFNKNRSLYKIIASQTEKDDLVQQEILPFSYRSRQIAIVTARSMFRQFGSRVIENGRRVRDDYWEQKARKQGFTEADMAGEKRPGAAKAREAAEAQNNVMMPGPHTEIVYSNNPGAYPGPQPPLVQAGMIGTPTGSTTRMPGLTTASDLGDTRPRDQTGIIRGAPRQEITGPAYQDQTRSAPLGELHSQAHHAAEYNRSVNQQRDMRNDYLQGLWRRPHEQPPTSLNQPVSSADSVPTSRPSNSPHTAASGMSQTPAVASQSPQMMMTAAPYSQSIQAQNTPGQAPIRGTSQFVPGQRFSSSSMSAAGSSGSIGQGSGYNYPSNPTMWSQPPQTPQQQQQHNYGSYTTQSQAPHPSQSPAAPHLRQPGSGQMQQGNMQFPGMSNMSYGASSGMYPAEQTPRGYMPQSSPGNPQVSQGWSSQHSPPQQWWAPQQQQPQ